VTAGFIPRLLLSLADNQSFNKIGVYNPCLGRLVVNHDGEKIKPFPIKFFFPIKIILLFFKEKEKGD